MLQLQFQWNLRCFVLNHTLYSDRMVQLKFMLRKLIHVTNHYNVSPIFADTTNDNTEDT